MYKIRRKLLIISTVGLVLFCLFQIFTYSNLEITDKNLFSVYRNLSFLLFCILLVILSIVLPKDFPGLFGRLGIMFVILLTGLIWVFVTVFFPFNDAKRDRKVLFVNKLNPKLLIIEQVSYAGAIGSDHYDTVFTRQLMKNVRWTKPVRISEINQDIWMPAGK